jgi:hypothetical protein
MTLFALALEDRTGLHGLNDAEDCASEEDEYEEVHKQWAEARSSVVALADSLCLPIYLVFRQRFGLVNDALIELGHSCLLGINGVLRESLSQLLGGNVLFSVLSRSEFIFRRGNLSSSCAHFLVTDWIGISF